MADEGALLKEGELMGPFDVPLVRALPKSELVETNEVA